MLVGKLIATQQTQPMFGMAALRREPPYNKRRFSPEEFQRASGPCATVLDSRLEISSRVEGVGSVADWHESMSPTDKGAGVKPRGIAAL